MKMQIKWTSIKGIDLKCNLFCNVFASSLDCKHIISAAADLYLDFVFIIFPYNLNFLAFICCNVLQWFSPVHWTVNTLSLHPRNFFSLHLMQCQLPSLQNFSLRAAGKSDMSYISVICVSYPFTFCILRLHFMPCTENPYTWE